MCKKKNLSRNGRCSGPAEEIFVEQLESLRDKDVAEGAQILFEKLPNEEDQKKGFYFPITLMANCSPYMECANKELFGASAPCLSCEKQPKSLGGGQ